MPRDEELVRARRPAMNALNMILSAHWAMEEHALRTMLEIAARENEGPEAVAARLGKPLDNTRAVTVRDGIATIPATGPMFRRATMFTEISGATSYDQLATDFTKAMDDRQVRAILLDLDSPGGDASGVSQLAALIASARGVKPVVAFINGTGASAAYWIASAAAAVIVSDTGIAGSIGVRASYRDTTAIDSARGIKTIDIVSSQSPNKKMDPTEDTGRAALQVLMDDLAQVFIESAAAYRGLTPEQVLADFGQGGLFVGRAAVDAGLADAVGTYESTFAALRDRGDAAVATWRGAQQSARASARSGRARADVPAVPAAVTPSISESPMNEAPKAPPAADAGTPPAASAPAALPAASSSLSTVIDADAVRKDERTRIAALRTLGRGADVALVERCIDDGMSADAAARVFLEAQHQSASARLQQLRTDETAPTPAVTSTSTGPQTDRAAAKSATAAFHALTAPRAASTGSIR